MKPQRSSSHTDGPSGLAGCSAFDLPFGAINGPGLASGSRNHTRSCRCGLVRRLGGGISVLAHTNRPVRRTGRLTVADTCCARLVGGSSCQPFDGEVGLASAVSNLLCGLVSTRSSDRALFGGSDTSDPQVASAMTSASSLCRPHRPGKKDVTANTGFRRPTALFSTTQRTDP